MKRNLSVWLMTAFVLLSSGLVWGTQVSFSLKGGYFLPTGEDFKEVYEGGPLFGGDIAVAIVGPLDIWAGGDFFSKSGKLTFTQEDTKIRITSLSAGLRARLTSSSVCPYLAAGVGYFLYKEENILGTFDGNVLGFVGQAGLLVSLSQTLAFDIYGRYNICKETVIGDAESFNADIGGFQAGGGLVIRF